MINLDRFQEGSACHLVFKTQPFTPVPNIERQSMDMKLNIFSGIYRGKIEDDNSNFLFETGANVGGVMWTVDKNEVLMAGTETNSADIARV